LRIQSAARNRSFKRDSQGNLVSETSKREKRK
jgi:YD repeat-containing protein